MGNKILDSILDLFFPRKCLGCGRWGGYFCSQCLNRLSLNRQPICPACQKGSVGGYTHPRCRTPQGLDGLTAVFAYQGLIKKAIKKLKYRFVSDIAEDLVEAFLSFCGENKSFVHFCQKRPLLSPVPLHPRRERWRGFNQAELLGEMIAANLGLTFNPNLLLRVKNTKPQTELKKKARKENIKGAFKVNPGTFPASPVGESLLTSRVLLFDDIWTSGATLKEAARVLKRNGVKRVWGLTLAR